RTRATSPPPWVVSMRSRAIVSCGSASATMRPCHSQRPRLCRPRVSPGRETSHENKTVTQTTLHKNVARRREKGAAFKAVCSYCWAWCCEPTPDDRSEERRVGKEGRSRRVE